jgi:hypothetical protein
MSTKTLRKRIALVAVSALGAGLLSVVAVPSASAAQVTTGNVAANNMIVSGSICAASDLIGGAPITTAGGAELDTSPFETTATGKVIVVPVGGLIVVESDALNYVTISGPLSVQAAGTGGIVGITNGKVTLNEDGLNAELIFQLSASAVGTATLVAGATADATPTAANTIKVSIVAACASSTISLTTTLASVEDSSIASVDNVDLSAAQADTESGFLSIVGKNAYGVAVPTGTWIVSATNGALVGIAAGTAAAGSTSMASVSNTGADIRVAVAQATAGVAQSSVVTVSYGTTVVATRTFTWTGDLAKITVSSVSTGKTAQQNFNSFVVRTYDAAGNQIAWGNTLLTITGTDQNVTAADAVATASAADEATTTNDGNYFTCGAGAKGTTQLTVKGINSVLGSVLSTPFAAKCSSTPYTWTASMDKASYVPGDVAVVTITAKDSDGNLVHDAVSAAADDVSELMSYVYGVTGTAPVVTGSNLTPVVAPASADKFTAGVKTYSFIVGSTEGSYQLAVQLAGIATDTAKTVSYKIAASTATIQLADVLKAIVSLIASINKQIAALQKALLKK